MRKQEDKHTMTVQRRSTDHPGPSGPVPAGAAVVIVGGGVTGLSAGWWLASAGVDVLVLDAGLIGWGASGRNGGGCSHHHSPLFLEEQRLWPMMDELLGYPTEFRPDRIRIALDEHQFLLYRRALDNGAFHGLRSDILDPAQVRELVPFAGDNVFGGYFSAVISITSAATRIRIGRCRLTHGRCRTAGGACCSIRAWPASRRTANMSRV
jgi:hypothetical protein